MDEDDFVIKKPTANPILLAPKRPSKKIDDEIEEPPSLFSGFEKKEESFGLSALDSPKKEIVLCPLCNKDISNLNSVRRSLHTNNCLDGHQSKKNFEKAKEKHSLTVDCPICRKPLEPGPFRSAHIKKCGKDNNVPANKLVDLVEVQSKAIEIKKRKGLNHTNASIPTIKTVKAPKLNNEPKTKFDEEMQLAKALSESMESETTKAKKPPLCEKRSPEFERIEDPKANRRRKARSYSIVQLAPHDCKCEVISLLHDRFLSMFKTKKGKAIKDDVEKVTKKANFHAIRERKLLDKLIHLESLSKDLYTLCDPQNAEYDFILKCRDGEVGCHRIILQRRTKGIVTKFSFCMIDEDTEIVKHWVSYINSGAIEWSQDQNDAIRRLADKYGPETISIACNRVEKIDDDAEIERSFLRAAGVSSSAQVIVENKEQDVTLTEGICLTTTITNDENPPECDNPESTSPCDVTESLDCEDPLQGIIMNNTVLSENSEITIIADIPKQRSPAIKIRPTEINPETFTKRSSMSSFDKQDSNILPMEKSTSPAPEIKKSPAPETKATETPDQPDFYEPNYDFDDVGYNEFYNESFWRADPDSEGLKELPPTEPDKEYDGSKEPEVFIKSSALTKVVENVETEIDSFDIPDLNIPPIENVKPFSKNYSEAINLPPENAIGSPSTSFNHPLAQSTPLQPASKRLKFGSNVKILKTSDITPMPDYEGMDDNELKKELARHGLRPMGRKRAVEYLRQIYDSIHPVIDPSTPTVRPLIRQNDRVIIEQAARNTKALPERSKPQKRQILFEETTPTKAPPVVVPSSPASSDDDLGNQTLNEPQDEPIEESMIDSALPKDINGMTLSFLVWLRKPENEELYSHMLSLQPVMIDELHVRLLRSDDPASLIPKKSLGAILDRMGITFSLPQPTGGRRGMGAIKRKK